MENREHSCEIEHRLNSDRQNAQTCEIHLPPPRALWVGGRGRRPFDLQARAICDFQSRFAAAQTDPMCNAVTTVGTTATMIIISSRECRSLKGFLNTSGHHVHMSIFLSICPVFCPYVQCTYGHHVHMSIFVSKCPLDLWSSQIPSQVCAQICLVQIQKQSADR